MPNKINTSNFFSDDYGLDSPGQKDINNYKKRLKKEYPLKTLQTKHHFQDNLKLSLIGEIMGYGVIKYFLGSQLSFYFKEADNKYTKKEPELILAQKTDPKSALVALVDTSVRAENKLVRIFGKVKNNSYHGNFEGKSIEPTVLKLDAILYEGILMV